MVVVNEINHFPDVLPKKYIYILSIMALPPKFANHIMNASANTHSIEVYLDYVCPFSAKMFNMLQNVIMTSHTSFCQRKLG